MAYRIKTSRAAAAALSAVSLLKRLANGNICFKRECGEAGFVSAHALSRPAVAVFAVFRRVLTSRGAIGLSHR